MAVVWPLEEDTQHRRALHEFQVLCTHHSPARRISPSPTSWSPPTSWSSPSRWSRRRRKRCERPDAQIICCHCCSFPRDCTTTRTKDISQKWKLFPKSAKLFPKGGKLFPPKWKIKVEHCYTAPPQGIFPRKLLSPALFGKSNFAPQTFCATNNLRHKYFARQILSKSKLYSTCLRTIFPSIVWHQIFCAKNILRYKYFD